MTAKEWLQRPQKLQKELDLLIDGQAERYYRTVSISGSSNAEVVQGTKGNRTEQKYISYLAYSDKIQAKRDKLKAVRREIIDTIQQVDDKTLQRLLYERYLRYKPWEQVAKSIDYSIYHTTHILHPRALEAIEQKFTKKVDTPIEKWYNV